MPAPDPRIDRWTDDYLNRMRMVGDPEADQLIKKYFEPGPPIPMAELLGTLLGGAGRIEDLPEELRYMLEATDESLAAVDREALERGQQMFRQHGPEILWVLACYSLPAAYAAPRGVRVLRRTGRLKKTPELRLLDTALILTRVMGPHALDRGHPGIRAARKVRLIHAVQRARIQNDPDIGWNPDEISGDRGIPLGIPINQEDLAGTLLTFSTAVLQGLHTLGIRIDPKVQEDYMCTWTALGGILGVHDDLIPRTVEEGEALMQRIHVRQHGPSRDGKEMTDALIGLLRSYQPFFLKHLPSAMIRFFMHPYPKVPDYIGVKRYSYMRPVIHVMVALTRLTNRLIGRTKLYRRATYHMIRSLMKSMRGERREDFEIPDELLREWFPARRVRRLKN
jgi:hypothetical protein